MKKYLIILLALITIGISAWLIKHFNTKKDDTIASDVLPPDVREKIIVDPRHSKITVITKDRTDILFLPDRPTAIVIPKVGPVRIDRRTWGFEMAPFAALVVTDTLRAGIGADGFYWNKWNFGSGIGLNVPNLFGDKSGVQLKTVLDVRFFTHVSYNVYSNTSLGLVLDTNKNIGLDLSFRF